MTLGKLIEAVEAGTLCPDDDWDILRDLFPMSQAEIDAGDYESDEVANIRNAYRGSLDAAKALHDALLPGWRVVDVSELNSYGLKGTWLVELASWTEEKHVSARLETPARAWLLAILRALEGGEHG